MMLLEVGWGWGWDITNSQLFVASVDCRPRSYSVQQREEKTVEGL